MNSKIFKLSTVFTAVFGIALQVLPVNAQAGEFYSIEKGQLERPTGYREWIYVGTPLTPNDLNDGKAATGGEDGYGHGGEGGLRLAKPSNPVKPTWVDPHPTRPVAYVALNGAAQVVEVDLESWSITRRFSTAPGPYNLMVSDDGKRMVVSYKTAGSVGIWDLERNEELARVPASRKVTHGVTISPDSRYAFVSNEADGTVTVVDLWNERMLATVEVGKQPRGGTVLPGDIEYAVALAGEPLREALLREYFDTMILRDVIQRYNVSKPSNCTQLYRYLLSNIAKPHTLQSAYAYLKQAGHATSRDSVRDYLHWAEDAWLMCTVPIYSHSQKEQERNYKKIYCIDWALAVRNSSVWDGSFARALENLVYLHLRRSYDRLYYYLTRSKRQEVDFIAVDKQGKPALAVQVCSDLSAPETLEREIAPLAVTARHFDIPEALVITRNEESDLQRDGIRITAVPAWKWLLM